MGGRAWANSHRIILQRGPYVIDLAVVSDVEQALGDAKALGAVAQQIELRI